MNGLAQEVRIGIRMLGKHPAFSAIAILVLGIGIGANTATFSVINALLFRPSGIAQPDLLRGFYSKDSERLGGYRAFSYPNYVDIRERADLFQSVMAHDLSMVGIGEGEETRRVFASVVSSNYFQTLGVSLSMGRAFRPEEELPGAGRLVAVIGHHLWKRRGADPEILGQTIVVNGQSFTVVGVAPDSFIGLLPSLAVDVFLPMGVWETVANSFGGTEIRSLDHRDFHRLFLVGRLKEGISPGQADAQLATLADQLQAEFPGINRNQLLSSAPMSRFSISTSPPNEGAVGAVAAFLMGMAGIVLLISCLNLGNMQASRSAARRQEFAVRMALGGSRRRVVRQLLIEGLLLSLCGGVLGFFLSLWAPGALIRSLGRIITFQLVIDTTPDWRVVTATLAFCLLSTVFFSLRPALRLARSPLFEDLKAQRGSGESEVGKKGFLKGRNLPVISEVALSLALLIVAGLFVRGAMEAAGVDPGFRTEGTVLIETDSSLLGYSDEQSRSLYQEILERLRNQPGVESASLTSTIPFGMTQSGATVQAAGVPFDAGPGADPSPGTRIVGADFFEAFGVPILDGRGFSLREEQTDQPVVVIDRVLAEALWPGQRAVGKLIHFRGDDERGVPEHEVIGVASPIQEDFFSSEPAGHVYTPFGSSFQPNVHFVIRARNEAQAVALMKDLRGAIREADARFPFLNLRTVQSHLEQSMSYWLVRAAANVFSAFGFLSLLLAVIGVYGVRAYSVVRRTREIGVRMALGASAGDTIWMILREGMVITLVGSILGILLAAGLGRMVGSVLYGVSGSDLLVFGLGTLILAAVMMLACYLPARRAALIDPLQALRCD